MRRAHWLTLLLVTACQTDEMRAWAERRAALERRRAELIELEAKAPKLEAALAEWDVLRASLDLAGFVRTHGIPARVFTESGAMRATVSGSVETCAEALSRLEPVAWLLPRWRLRIEGARCEWEGETGEALSELEQTVLRARPSWAPPSPSWLSRGVAAEQAKVRELEAEVAAREQRLGGLATLGPISEAVRAAVAKAKALPRGCPLEVVHRELAQDERGRLLELTAERPVQPLEPANDARLRGLLEADGPAWRWRCPAP
ncbi:MAG: hypothetical protein ACOZQL_17975 [Myxococcota bacterium]